MTVPLALAIAWALLVPLVLLALSPLLDGVGRQIRARLESRAGPPLTQGYRDLAKLTGKDEVSAGVNPLATLLPWVALAAAVAAGALLPVAGSAPLGAAGDAIVVLYLLGLSTVAVVLAGSATGSPYGFLGAGREMVLLLFVEPVVACALFVVALKCGSFRLDAMVHWQWAHGPGVSGVLAGVGLAAALLGYMGRLPFDLSEAEQELMGGVTLEFGGRRLALLRWTLFVRWLVVAWLAVALFAPVPLAGVAGAAVQLVEVAVLFGIVSALTVLFARLRVDHLRAYLLHVGMLMVFALLFALIGA
jgi:formate hydrogenlyase subunit 4